MAPIPEIPADSLEYVRVQVQARVAGTAYDPTSDTVELAFKPGTTPPDEADWHTGSWETDTSTGTPTYRAMCLVGPSAVELDPDTWRVWVRVDSGDEVPVRPAGYIKIV